MDGVEQTVSALAAAIWRDDPTQLNWESLQTLHLQEFAAYCLAGRLPVEKAAELRKAWTARGIADMKQEAAYRDLSACFQKEHIRFCPLKGADLAWRVYPAGGLRSKCDLDILIHPDDLQHLLAVLSQNDWRMPYQYRSVHHLPQMYKKGVVLEVHFHLPHLEQIPDTMLWSELRKVEQYRYQLPLEWNLAMLFHHARHHQWSNGMQLLLDSAFLVKKEGAPDWKKMAEITQNFPFASPALLFNAFPDFFPAKMQPPTAPPAEICRIFRALILAENHPHQFVSERVMGDAARFSRAWWMERLKKMHPASIRIQTGNSRRHYGRLLMDYCRMLQKKWKMFRNCRPDSIDPVILKRLQDEKTIETFLH